MLLLPHSLNQPKAVSWDARVKSQGLGKEQRGNNLNSPPKGLGRKAKCSPRRSAGGSC